MPKQCWDRPQRCSLCSQRWFFASYVPFNQRFAALKPFHVERRAPPHHTSLAKRVLRRRHPVRDEREPYSSSYSLLQLREGVVQLRAPPERILLHAGEIALEEVEDLLVVARVVGRPGRRGGVVEDVLQEAGEVARVELVVAVLRVAPTPIFFVVSLVFCRQ